MVERGGLIVMIEREGYEVRVTEQEAEPEEGGRKRSEKGMIRSWLKWFLGFDERPLARVGEEFRVPSDDSSVGSDG